jgi:hypothetical protein
MSEVGKAIAAGLAGALVGGTEKWLDNRAAAKKDAAKDAAPQKQLIPNAPSYEIAYKMRQDQDKPSDDATE